MREIAKIHKGDFRLTANQNLIVAGVSARDKAKIEALAREYGLISDGVTRQRETAWPASRCRPARWPWPKPNASCRRLSTMWTA